MQRIIVLNPKGGSGKTTVATNLAACYAATGHGAALIDLDPQGSTTRWLSKRPGDAPTIHGIAGFHRSAAVTRSWQMRIPTDCDIAISDTPAAIDTQFLPDLTRGADFILVPVMPSDLDIHATAKCIADLLLVAKIRRSENRIGIIANRVRTNTRISQSLTRFLQSLDIPLIATLRDTQSYVRSAEVGLGVYEMPAWQVQNDLAHWRQVLDWLAEPRRRRIPRVATSSSNLVPIERAATDVERMAAVSCSGLASAAGQD